MSDTVNVVAALLPLTPRTQLEIDTVGLLNSPSDGVSPSIPAPDLAAILSNVDRFSRLAANAHTTDPSWALLLSGWLKRNQSVIESLALVCALGDTTETSCNSTYPHMLLWTYGETLELVVALASLCPDDERLEMLNGL